LGSGSGFVIGSDGRVVTNYHVVHMPGRTQAEARFADGASYQVQGVLATDPDKDLAVLKLQATGKVFQVVHLGDSGQVQIGERVLAIGNPLAGVSPVSTEATVSEWYCQRDTRLARTPNEGLPDHGSYFVWQQRRCSGECKRRGYRSDIRAACRWAKPELRYPDRLPAISVHRWAGEIASDDQRSRT
jgi:hypothetical protein